MLSGIFDFSDLGGDYARLKTAIGEKKSSAVFYAATGARAFITAGLRKFFLYVTPDRLSARAAREALECFSGAKVVLLPEKDELLLYSRLNVSASIAERTAALAALSEEGVAGAVISAEGLNQYFPRADVFFAGTIKLQKGKDFDPILITDNLTRGGYRPAETVSAAGEFSRRGDILDIWYSESELPVRVEFFGDTIESLRQFAPDTMVSVKAVPEATIPPRSDFLLSKESAAALLKELSYQKNRAARRLAEIIAEQAEKLETNPSDPSLLWSLPFARESMGTVFDYLPADALVVLDEPRMIDDKLRLSLNAHSARVKSFTEAGEATAEHIKSLIPSAAVYGRAKDFTLLAFQQITSSNPIFEPRALFNLKSLPCAGYNINYELLENDVKQTLLSGGRVFIFAGSAGAASAISSYLAEREIHSVIRADGEERYEVLIIPERIPRGFVIPTEHILLVGTDDVVRKSLSTKSSARKRASFVMPLKGDYVVHEKHGIGISEGVATLDMGSGKKDYYVILYKEGDRLYLPVDRMDEIDKYTGGGSPTLHRIGGKEFERIKERVKESVKALAIDLLSLYEKRERAAGHKYAPDTVWQKELEESFEFTETDDQLIAVREIKDDMESGKVMDRLLCGDVGFGKTEVAVRAIFKTVVEGKQAAILAPTTILCQQHYNTISERFALFGIKIALLSRFVSQDTLNRNLKMIKSGEASVIVATHRLLSKDVVFHDLGLLVLDEEQRFGVEQKEKVKLLKNNVNVLSLSATPIPRSLHMSLSGIRDISTLETAPADRLPIETFVVEYSDALLQDAVKREINRGGQVFILYNRVKTINKFFARVQALLGEEVRIICAHGQLGPAELEERITAFYNREADVLISTTIIENGIDLPDANTLIVIDSDMLGLSELYQLRGRVGRAKNLAFAYFTVAESKVLTETAVKRLDTVAAFTELGSGFKVAMQDLEIRGAGDVLGREQHGNMEKVGYDTYCKLLAETVSELKGDRTVKSREVEIEAEGDLSLPSDYISDSERRVKFYKRTSLLTTPAEREALLAEMKDSDGAVPLQASLLTRVGLIKNLAKQISVKKIVAGRGGLGIQFYDASALKNEGLFDALSEFSKSAVLSPSDTPSVIFNNRGLDTEKRLVLLQEFLLAATGAH